MNKFIIQIPLLFLALALPVSIAGTNMGLALLTLGLLAAAAQGTKINWARVKNPAVYAVLIYAIVGVLVSILGVDFSVSLAQLYRDFHKLWALSLFLVALGSVAAAGVPEALGCGFGFVAIVALGQEIFQKSLNGGRAHAFVHPVTFGEQMALGALGGLCFLLSQPGSNSKWPARKSWLIVFTGLCGAALFFSQTRAALVGLAVGFGALCVADKSLRRQALWALGALVLFAAAWEIFHGGRGFIAALHPAVSGGENNTRLVLSTVALKAFRDHPLTGVGIGNYKTVFPHYFQGVLEGEPVWSSAHNIFLHQLAERGLIGLAALCLVLGVLTVRAWQRAKKNPGAWNLWALSSMAGFLVMNLTETAFQNEQMATLILFIWACAEASSS